MSQDFLSPELLSLYILISETPMGHQITATCPLSDGKSQFLQDFVDWEILMQRFHDPYMLGSLNSKIPMFFLFWDSDEPLLSSYVRLTHAHLLPNPTTVDDLRGI